jgi:hypothetical protein
MVRLGRLFLSIGLLASSVSMADCATRALVVGVSGYPKLPERIRLVGPKNDAREMANMLARAGVAASDITVLADGVTNLDPGIANPGVGDRQAVLDGLDRLAETSKPGDLVVFYFSGHGSQQPDLNGDEQGGADEIFLPYDVGSWSGAGVSNAIVDDDLNLRVTRILDKGVDFFGIIDACHSATGFRAIDGDDMRVRGVDPSELGVPSLAKPAARSLSVRNGDTNKPGRGRAAFFYAAQEDEEALEKTPKDAADGESFAVFTYQLISRMTQTPGLTYRRLHQAVVADIKRNTLMATQTPEIEGDMLDEPALRLDAAKVSRQWPIFNGKLQGGQLSGLSTGSLVALYDDAAAGDDKPVAYGRIDSAGATKSLVVPAAAPCGEADGVCATAAVADETSFKAARFARLVEPGVDLGLVLSEPVRIDPDDGHDYAAALAALKAAVGSGPLASRVSMRETGYDVAVALVDGKLAFSGSSGQVDRDGPGSSPRLTLPTELKAATAKVSESIDRMAKALALQRLGSSSDGARALGLATTVLVARSRVRPAAGEDCPEDAASYEAAVPVGDDPSLNDCDILSIDMANGGKKPLDVTVLLIGADFSITPVWPLDGNANRILSQEKKTADILQMEPNPAAASQERLVFLAIPGVNRSHTAFTDLAQEGLRAAPGEDTPEIAAVRDFVSTGLNDPTVTTIAKPPRVDEDMSIDIRPFFVAKGGS